MKNSYTDTDIMILYIYQNRSCWLLLKVLVIEVLGIIKVAMKGALYFRPNTDLDEKCKKLKETFKIFKKRLVHSSYSIFYYIDITKEQIILYRD